jgi:phosphatidylethanolamine-binding protein (PEBP) family uncharacterized protein
VHPLEVILSPLGFALRNRRPDEAASIANAPELATDTHFALASSAFADGQEIPAKYCGQFIGDEVSPPLTWGALPAGTQDVVLILEDLDTPTATPGIHTIAAFAPQGDGLAEGALTPTDPGIQFVPNHRGRADYVGPRPLPGHGPHRYRFHLYALDNHVDLSRLTDMAQVPALLAGQVLASGMTMGTRTS